MSCGMALHTRQPIHAADGYRNHQLLLAWLLLKAHVCSLFRFLVSSAFPPRKQPKFQLESMGSFLKVTCSEQQLVHCLVAAGLQPGKRQQPVVMS